MNSMADNEAALFMDAVHPTHSEFKAAARPAGCWAPKQEKLAIDPRIKSGETSGRQRIDIHGAIDIARRLRRASFRRPMETGQTRMIEVETVDVLSTIKLLEPPDRGPGVEALYPMLALIHVFLDNAAYHHAKLVREWSAQPGRRIKLRFVPAYRPHSNPPDHSPGVERLWG